VFALQPIKDGWMFGHCSPDGLHSPYLHHRALLSCRDAAAGSAEEEALQVQREDWDLGTGCDHIVVINSTAVAEGSRLLAAAAGALMRVRGWEDAADLLEESREAYSRGVVIPLSVCQDAYAQMMQQSLVALTSCGWGDVWSRMTDDHCVTIYGFHDWMRVMGGAVFVEWLRERIYRDARARRDLDHGCLPLNATD
jgi:hypothetical protein